MITNMKMRQFLSALCFFLVANTMVVAQEGTNQFSVDFETFTLENGLKVILHEDKSDPVVAVALSRPYQKMRWKK